MKTNRTERIVDGNARIELDADLFLEPELQADHRGSPLLTIAVSRYRSSGLFEITKLRVNLPRDSVTRLLHEIRKLHERERAQIVEDLAALQKP